MKKTVVILMAVLAMAVSANAGVILTGIVDGPYSGGLPKAVELYVDGMVDLSGWSINGYNNGSTTVNGGTTALSGIYTDEFVYVTYTGSDDEFALIWAAEGDFANVITGSAPNHNGDDAIALQQGETIVDVYGVIGVDGSGMDWDYLDTYAYRVNGTGPDGTFNVGDWTVGAVNALDGLSGSAVAAAVPFGTYQVPEPATMVLLGMGSLVLARRRK